MQRTKYSALLTVDTKRYVSLLRRTAPTCVLLSTWTLVPRVLHYVVIASTLVKNIKKPLPTTGN